MHRCGDVRGRPNTPRRSACRCRWSRVADGGFPATGDAAVTQWGGAASRRWGVSRPPYRPAESGDGTRSRRRSSGSTSVPTSDRHRRTSGVPPARDADRLARCRQRHRPGRPRLPARSATTGVRLVGRCHARQSNRDDMADGERREYFESAHGLLASMTALLDRVGVDTTIQLRRSRRRGRTDERERPRRRGLVPREHGAETVALRRPQRVIGGRSSNLGRTSSSTACRWISTRPPAPPI